MATSCYRYETREFEISIPEQADPRWLWPATGATSPLWSHPKSDQRPHLAEIPQMVRDAVIAIEDERFYIHEASTSRPSSGAARTNLEAGGISQGGSTITQQYVKLAIIRNTERTASRKLEEVWYATRLEDEYSKDFILLQYLNTVYLGHGAYGVKAAAQSYFNKDVAYLNLSEAALIAGIIQLPGRYNPFLNYSKSLKRSHMVLDRMLANEFITEEQHAAAVASPPHLEEYSARLETRYPAGHFGERRSGAGSWTTRPSVPVAGSGSGCSSRVVCASRPPSTWTSSRPPSRRWRATFREGGGIRTPPLWSSRREPARCWPWSAAETSSIPTRTPRSTWPSGSGARWAPR
ncbi:MAG: hypothetical protein Ct9H300mP12_00830 [Acidimicrobiales bacterium]|nr:MAG: hypothetical protein Ct9H300mP12_00830 [Acidimicrobiales bacterium]